MTRVESALKSAERVASPSQVKTQGWEAILVVAPPGRPERDRGARCPGERPAPRARKGGKRNRLKAKLTRAADASPKSAPAPGGRDIPGRYRPRPARRTPGRAQKLSGPRWQVKRRRAGRRAPHQRRGGAGTRGEAGRGSPHPAPDQRHRQQRQRAGEPLAHRRRPAARRRGSTRRGGARDRAGRRRAVKPRPARMFSTSFRCRHGSKRGSSVSARYAMRASGREQQGEDRRAAPRHARLHRHCQLPCGLAGSGRQTIFAISAAAGTTSSTSVVSLISTFGTALDLDSGRSGPGRRRRR